MRKPLGLRFFLTSAILAALVFALDVAFHVAVVPDLYLGYPQRSQAEIAHLTPFLFLTYVVQIMIFLWLFMRLYPEGGARNAIWWGLWGGLFVVIPNMQFFVGVAGTTWTLLGVQVVEAVILLIGATLAFDALYPKARSQPLGTTARG